MALEPVFLVNQNGGVHSVPGEWVTEDKFGHPLVRGNAGFDYASDEQIEDWHSEQGLDESDRSDPEPDKEAQPQIANMRVKEVPQSGNITAGGTAEGKSAKDK